MIEVRCCCDGHLVGHMEGRYTNGKTYTFILNLATRERFNDGAVTVTVERLQMTAMFWGQTLNGEQVGVVALQSRDYPIEKLKLIRGFHPVDEQP